MGDAFISSNSAIRSLGEYSDRKYVSIPETAVRIAAKFAPDVNAVSVSRIIKLHHSEK
ncbi:hypothetical protein [Aeromonas tecta]|uniref:hypothetical protein n=1 Tax=Aeromonas tecta TaxID=324617 RepID=UPI0018DB14CC|nr:hypothetical protein [Aeromonas tecta]